MAEEADQQEEEERDDQKGERSRFPVIPASHWWALRKKFVSRIPPTVDAKYVATALNMSEKSARSNVLPGLKAFGIIDDNCKTNQYVATRWRDDTQYPQVCKEFIQKAYPQELRDVAPNPLEEKETVRRWFGSHGVGEGLVRKASAIYFLLAEADPAKADQTPKREPTNGKRQPTKAKSAPAPRQAKRVRDDEGDDDDDGREDDGAASKAAEAAAAQAKLMRKLSGPQLHLNVQIHISPETTPEQIESVFASMAKHLKTLSE